VVDHESDEAHFSRTKFGLREPVLELGPEEYGLASVGVAGPFVEGEDGEELAAILDLGEKGVGDEVVDGGEVGVAGVLGGEGPAGVGWSDLRAELDGDGGILFEKLGGDLDEFGLGRGDLEVRGFRRR
jgi:hypothetical protein